MVLECVLVSSRNHENVGKSIAHGFFDNVLDSGLINDGKHLFRHRFGGGKESSPQTGSGNDRLRDVR